MAGVAAAPACADGVASALLVALLAPGAVVPATAVAEVAEAAVPFGDCAFCNCWFCCTNPEDCACTSVDGSVELTPEVETPAELAPTPANAGAQKPTHIKARQKEIKRTIVLVAIAHLSPTAPGPYSGLLRIPALRQPRPTAAMNAIRILFNRICDRACRKKFVTCQAPSLCISAASGRRSKHLNRVSWGDREKQD